MSAHPAPRLPPPRRSMRHRVRVGQRWRRRRDGGVMRIGMVHRADRLVVLVNDGGGRQTVSFTDLRRYWTEAG